MSRTRTISSWSSAKTAPLITSAAGRFHILVFGVAWMEKKGGRGRTCETVFVPLGHPHQGLGITFGCAKEALSIRIFANALEDGAHGGGESGLAGGLFGG